MSPKGWLVVSAVVALVTITLKTLAWWFTDSIGLLSDAMESVVNLASAMFGLVMVTLAAQPADEDHPYGHHKAEYFSSGFEGLLILLAALGIIWAALHRFWDPQPITQLDIGLALSLASSALNGGLAWVMSTLGFGIIIQNAALAVWGPAAMVVPSILGSDVIRIGGAGVLPQEILVLVFSICVMLALDYVMRKTKIGKAVRAVAHSKAAATLMGINVGAVVVLAFVLSSGLAGVAGLLIAPITTASVFMGLLIALKAFSAAIVGGLSNARGCMLGGFMLGIMEAMVGLWQAELRDISIFLLIIVVLVVKPEGLLGTRVAEKV
mgnify:CR=1 FL=1